MKTLKTPVKTLLRTAALAMGTLLLGAVSASAQHLYVSDISLDWDPGASTEIDEDTQVISFKPGDPITYTVEYGRYNTSSPPNGPQIFRVVVFLSPDGNGHLNGVAPDNLDNFQLDSFGSYGAGTFDEYADEMGLPALISENDVHPVRLEESGRGEQKVPFFSRKRTRTAMLPRNYTGTFFLTAVIQVTDGPADPRRIDNVATLTTARVNIQPADSATVDRVSNSFSGGDANEMSEAPSVSRDGRFVVYHSEATNILPNFNVPAGVAQVYLRDNLTDSTILLSQRGGVPGNQESRYPVISADGRYVAYQSTATNLVTEDTNQQTDVFLYQRATGVTTRISRPNADGQADRGSFLPAISGDGWTIAFETDATNLVTSPVVDTNGLRDVYVFRRSGAAEVTGAPVGGRLFPVSATREGVFGDGASSQANVSLDNRSVGFRSFAENLPTPSTGLHDGKAFEPVTRRGPDGRRLSEVYVKDLSYVDESMSGSDLSDGYGYVVRASFKRSLDYAIGFELNRDSFDPVISGDGRYVAFASQASNVQPFQQHANTANVSQVYLLNRQVDLSRPRDQEGNTALSLISQAPDGDFGGEDSLEPVISGNGQYVGFRTESPNVQPEKVTRSDGVIFNTRYRSEWDAPQDWAAVPNPGELYNRLSAGPLSITNFTDTNTTSDIYIRDTGIVSVQVDHGGSGYSAESPPEVRIIGGGGAGAQAVAFIQDGQVARIDVIARGAGYTLPHDLLTIDPLYEERLQVLVEGNAEATALLTDGNERVTVSKFGKETFSAGPTDEFFSTASARNLAMSTDGRYMTFASDSYNRGSFIFGKSDWHPLDNNQKRDVFMVDRRVGEVLSPEQGILPIVAVTMDNHPATFGSNRVIRISAFDGASNPTGLDGQPQDTRGRITNMRIFANEMEFQAVTTKGINTQRATGRTTWTVPSIAGAYQIYAIGEDIDGNIVASAPVNIQVSPPSSLPPQVNLTVTPSAVTLGDTVTIRAFPSDPDNGVSFVRYFSNGTQIGLTLTNHIITYTPSEVEDYEIVAVVADGPPPEEDPPEPALRNTRMSSTQILRVLPLPSPEVAIIRPAAGADVEAVVGEPVFLELQALTSNPTASISAVSLVIDNGGETERIPAARVGLTSNYRVEWRPEPSQVGTVSFYAEAIDSQGTSGHSDPRPAFVHPAPVTRPLVAIFSPEEGGTGFTNETITVKVEATGAHVERVDLYANGALVGQANFVTATGFFEDELDLSRLGAGEFDLIAVAYGSSFITRASLPVRFVIANPRPEVAILTPVVDPVTDWVQTRIGQPVLIVVYARSPDPLLSINNVSVTVDDTTVGVAARLPDTHLYTLVWTPAATGLRSVAANATDSAGGTVITPGITVRVTESDGSPPPTVAIISPENGFRLTNRSEWSFVATAVSEEWEIDNVDFFIRRGGDPGLGIPMGTAERQPDHDAFRLTFDLANLPAHFAPFIRLPSGTYEIIAVARDEVGNQGQSAPVSVTVSPTLVDRPQLAGLTANKTAAALNESIRFSLTVADPVPPITEVSLYGNGVLLAQMETDFSSVQPGKVWSWDGLIAAPGIWNVYAVVRDNNGNFAISNAVEVAVGRALLRLDAPETVNLDSENPAPVVLELEILAGNPEIAYVQFWVNGVFFQADTSAPYIVNWTPQAAGTYEIEARAWDSEFFEFLVAPSVTVGVVAPPVPPVFAWQTQGSGTSADLNGVTHFNGTFVAVGAGGTVLTSGGGGWTNRSGGVPASETLRAVVGGNNVLVAVGDIVADGEDPESGRGRIITSSNGSTWRARPSGTIRRLTGVAYGAGRFVAVGNGGVIRTSEEGAIWQGQASSATSNLLAVTYGSAGFVAVGENGTIVTSLDGISWKSQTAQTSAALNDVAFGDGRYVAVGGRWVSGSDSARILTSADGVSWNVGGSGIPSIMRGVRYGSGAWVVAGSGGTLASSADGLAWVADPDSATTAELLAVAHGGGKFVAVGRGGAIVHSQAGNFATWVAQQFTAEEQGDETISGADADPHGTGVSNLMRYALGIEDAASLLERMPQAVVVSNPTEPYLALRYVRPKEQKDVAYVVEASGDLNTWEPVETIGGSIAVEVNGTTETVTARDGVTIAAGGERRFLRLRVKELD